MTFAEKMLEAAEEGIVLLKNENQALPLVSSETVSVFGRIQFDFYRSGTGSGGSVHVPYVTNLTDSLIQLEDEGFAKVNRELAQTYRDWIKENPFDSGSGWAQEPFCQKDMEISSALAAECAKKSSKAIYVIGRLAGEDKDFVNEKGSWLLNDTERKNISVLCGAFEKVIIVFNTCGIMDTAWIDDSEFKNHIAAVLYAWHGGQEGGRACANVLCGKAVPSGKLTDTIALNMNDYPSTANFAHDVNFYEEDIYVGYRYFQTFAPEKVLFPFGFGLSYAKFELGNLLLSVSGDVNSEKCDAKITVTVVVKNVSKEYCGKEVVQLYFDAPSNSLQTPSRQLAAFKKTRLLKPGESETLEISFAPSQMAAYDDSGASGNSHCWILQGGEYRIFAGTDVASAKEVFGGGSGKPAVTIEKTLVLENCEQSCAPELSFERIRQGAQNSGGVFALEKEGVPLSKIKLSARIAENLPKEIAFTGNKGITFDDVKKDRSLLEAFIAQLEVKELATMVRGEGMLSRKVTPGIAAAFGGLSPALHDVYKIPCAGCSDGPSGIRLDTGKEANLVPIGTLLACTWNPDLVKELYIFEGKELSQNKIDALLGPGMNVHRNPLNGRNFEYFSEDPLLTGIFACAEIEGLKEGGSNATVKHFALNSQETNRRAADAIVSERAIREIYLKGFEMAVKGGVLKSIMTSYNPIQGHWAASNYELVNSILRKEWKYTGIVMTDWWASMNNCVDKKNLSVKNMASMIRAGTDVYMVVDNDGAEKNIYGDNIEESISGGDLTLGELQTSVRHILNFILDAPVSSRPLGELVQVEKIEPLAEGLGSPKAEACGLKGLEIIKNEQKFVPAQNRDYALALESDGIYAVGGLMCKVENRLSQSSSIILINDEPAASFECRTTQGANVFINATQVKMKKGVYKIRLEHTKPGIEIRELVFTSNNFNPVEAGLLD